MSIMIITTLSMLKALDRNLRNSRNEESRRDHIGLLIGSLGDGHLWSRLCVMKFAKTTVNSTSRYVQRVKTLRKKIMIKENKVNNENNWSASTS